jgi:hypothetical protein
LAAAWGSVRTYSPAEWLTRRLCVEHASDPALCGQLVDGRYVFQGEVTEQESDDRPLRVRAGSFRTGFPAPLDGSDDLVAAAAPFGLIAVIVTPRFSLALAADISFVGLNDTVKQAAIVFHHGAEAVHAVF